MKRIAIFASGNGSNAKRIALYFSGRNDVEVSLIFTNNLKAGVIERADKVGIRCIVFNKSDFVKGGKVDLLLKENKIDLIVLAGFLWLVPEFIINDFPNKIINIHPALLPKYGGKGMYGMNVHNAVISANEAQSGISIHYVNNIYDEGQIIFQATVDIDEDETSGSLAEKIHELEYEHFPIVIDKLLKST